MTAPAAATPLAVPSATGVARATIALLLAASLLPGCQRRGGESIETRAGGLTIRAALQPDPPRLQDNALEIEILDGAGDPLEDAALQLDASMPAMGAMPAMRTSAIVTSLGDGRYRAAFDLGMSATWSLALRIKSATGESEVRYSLTVGNRGLQAIGSGTSSTATVGGDSNAASPAPGAISHYTCSMHPSVHEDGPGTCPICSMDLIPVTKQEVASGEIVVEEGRRQRIGVRTGRVERRQMSREIRAVGRVTYDEAGLAEVSVKYPGWIDRLEVNTTGQAVKKGQTLFTLYSPELYAAQSEFLTFLRSQQAARQTAAPARADYLVDAARQRLRLWDLQDWQIARIAKSGKPARHQPIVSPVSGFVIEKNVVAGAAVQPGATLFRIASLDRVWVEADLPESELPLVAVGQQATVTLPYLPGEGMTGRVAFILPYLDAAARTGRVRIELPNRDLQLKPDMFADVSIQIDGGERLMVAQSAVLYAGARRLVFLDLGEGRLKPRDVEIGAKSGEFVEVLSGLEAGDLVVTSGTFLVAAESRLKSATEQWQ